MDIDLVADIADFRPDLSIVMIGPVVKIDPASLPRRRAEAAEAADFDLVAAAQGTNDAVENRLHDHFRLFSGHFHDSGDFFNQIRFRHVSTLLLIRPVSTAVSLDCTYFATAYEFSSPRSLRLMTSSMVVVAAAACR